MRGFVCTVLVALASSFLADPALAQRRAPAEVDVAIAQLSSESAADVQAGLEALGILGSPRAIPAIADRVRRGLPVELLELAVQTLGILGRADAGPVLLELSQHRRVSVRRSAVEALVATRAPGAADALRVSLADGDPEVRSAAAVGLGTLGATGALDDLFRALERDVDGAALAIAQIAGPPEVERFLAALGRLPFDEMAPALNEMLMREQLPERTRLVIVHRIAELATPGAAEFLRRFVASLPAEDHSSVHRAAEDAAARIGQ